MRTHPPDALVSVLREADRFLIVAHVDPDPDSVGSTLGLWRMLRAMGKECLAVVPTPLPPMLRFLPHVDVLLTPDQVQPGTWDHLVVLDCGVERTGGVAAWAGRAGRIVNIDHHATNQGTGTLNWIDATYAATTEMVAALSESLGVALDLPIATLLYTGLVGDTGWFRFSNTTPEALRLAARLLSCGVDVESINRHLNESHSLEYVKLLALMLGTVTTAYDGRVVYARVTRTMRDAVGASFAEGDGFVQYLKLIRDTDVVVLFDETEAGPVRVQFRSSSSVDVSRIAQSLGGGGHARAAGVRIQGAIDEVEAKVLRVIGESLGAS